MLHSERKRQSQLIKDEALGKNVWRKDAPEALRTKFTWLVESFGWVENSYDRTYGYERIKERVIALIHRSTGHQSWSTFGSQAANGDSDEFIDLIEASFLVISAVVKQNNSIENKSAVLTDFTEQTNNLLESYRMAYSLENNQIVEFDNREIHKEVVVPTLTLLANPDWAKAETAYHDALKSMSDERFPDAITDATTALQEGLRIVGCKGGNFADLIKSAKSTILSGFDTKYIEGITKLIDWSSASRSEKGDGHKTTDADRSDAWLTIHLVGTLLLYISKKFPHERH